jgi:cytoskeletal protein CcmA (bactofilin family)
VNGPLSNVSGPQLVTDVFDSSSGDLTPRSGDGSVGINDYLSVTSVLNLQVGGSLQVAGPKGISLASGDNLNIGQDLEVATNILGAQAVVDVKGDARVGGDVDLGSLTVGGTLTLPSEHKFSGVVQAHSGVTRDPVSVGLPCGCDSKDFRDIASLVTTAAGRNDNATAPLERPLSDLNTYSGPITMRVPCGRFYLNRLVRAGALTLLIEGRVELYVSGQVNLDGPVTVVVPPGAKFDLFVEGELVATGDLNLGLANNSGRVRLFVWGKTINLGGKSLFAGSIYAPNATLVCRGQTEVFGSVFADRVDPSSRLIIHRDLNPTEAGSVCPDG